jgi:hypothetical protein
VAENPEASPRRGLDGIGCVRIRVLGRNVGNGRMQCTVVQCLSVFENLGAGGSSSYSSSSMGVGEVGRYGERGVGERII